MCVCVCVCIYIYIFQKASISNRTVSFIFLQLLPNNDENIK